MSLGSAPTLTLAQHRAAFDRYLERFNARDYEFILSHYAEQFELRFVDAFVASYDMIAIECVVRLEDVRAMPKEAASAAGFEGIIAPFITTCATAGS